MNELKQTDFVQVLTHTYNKDSGEVITYWRNALYLGHENGVPAVIFTDGSKLAIHKDMKIRGVIWER